LILEHAILQLKPGMESDFEQAMAKAVPLISATEGFRQIEVRPCLEEQGRYLLMVTWDSVEAHEVGFRKSDRYQEWRKLLHHFYEPFPVVQHYGPSILVQSGAP
jgi:heme-degrading monooxygenase HmoA